MPATITLFSNLTNPTGPELDNNFLAYAVFGTIPCSASGTNNLTLTQNSNTPTLSELTDGIQFSALAAGTNTTTVTANVSGFGVLNVYKDSLAGPVALSGGELISGNAFTLRYDSTLNSGNGGYRIYTNTEYGGGTITSNVVVAAGGFGATLASTGLSGASITISALAGSVTALKVGASASSLTRMISGLGTLTFTVTPANSSQNQSFALAGAQIHNSVALGVGTSVPSGAGFSGYMSATGTVTMRLTNPSTVTLAAATLTVRATALGFT